MQVQSFDRSVRSMFTALAHHLRLHNTDMPVYGPDHNSLEKAELKPCSGRNQTPSNHEHHQCFTWSSMSEEAPSAP